MVASPAHRYRTIPGNGMNHTQLHELAYAVIGILGALLQRHDGILEVRSRTPVERDRLRVVFFSRAGEGGGGGLSIYPLVIVIVCLVDAPDVVISSEVDCLKH